MAERVTRDVIAAYHPDDDHCAYLGFREALDQEMMEVVRFGDVPLVLDGRYDESSPIRRGLFQLEPVRVYSPDEVLAFAQRAGETLTSLGELVDVYDRAVHHDGNSLILPFYTRQAMESTKTTVAI